MELLERAVRRIHVEQEYEDSHSQGRGYYIRIAAAIAR